MSLEPLKLPNTYATAHRFPKIVTKNLTPGVTFFDKETPWFENDVEYRELDPTHSKLGAAIANGCQQFGIKEGCTVLYLGASHGYTPSFVSDMVGKDGTIYCLDVAPRVVRDLVFVCDVRENMIPMLADARNPATFAARVTTVDVIFQDIAQRDQVDIFLKNVRAFLKPGGFAMLALKARSVDVTRRPNDIFNEVKKLLDNTQGVSLIDYRSLDPHEKDHAFFVIKKKFL